MPREVITTFAGAPLFLVPPRRLAWRSAPRGQGRDVEVPVAWLALWEEWLGVAHACAWGAWQACRACAYSEVQALMAQILGFQE